MPMNIAQVWIDGEHWEEFKDLCKGRRLPVRRALSTIVALAVADEEFWDFIAGCIEQQRVKIEVSVKERTKLERERREIEKLTEIEAEMIKRKPELAEKLTKRLSK